MRGLKIHAFSGPAVMGGWVGGWKRTSAAYIVAVLRAMYGDEFTWQDFEDFKYQNGLENWEPYEDLTYDGEAFVGGAGEEFWIPDGFDLSGQSEYYSRWAAGESIASLPKKPQTINIPATPVPAYVPPQPAYVDEEWSDLDTGDHSSPPPAYLPSQPAPAAPPQYTPPASAQPVKPSTAAVAAQKKQTDWMPILLIGGGVAVALWAFGGKKRR